MSTTQQEQTRAAASQEYLLEMRGITKAFAGVQALKGVDFYVRPGTVHALMGENGAGKSTLMKCLFGIYHKDEGTISVNQSFLCLLYKGVLNNGKLQHP